MSSFAPPIPSPVPAPESFPVNRAPASLWRRFLAFVVDGIILGVAVNLAALFLFEPLSHLGAWGRLVGFLVTLPYFAILDSTIGNGQTIGKRLLRVQVVDRAGNTISLGKSAWRYSLFAVPYFLNGILLPTSRTPGIASFLVELLIFGLGGATLYLLLFNRHSRQGLHDIAAGAYLADVDKSGPVQVKPIWKMHWVVLGFLFAIVAVGGTMLGNRVAKSGSFPQMLEDVRLLEGMQGVQAAGVQDLNWINYGSGARQTILVVNVYSRGKSADEEAFADTVAKLMMEHDPGAKEHDLLRVRSPTCTRLPNGMFACSEPHRLRAIRLECNRGFLLLAWIARSSRPISQPVLTLGLVSYLTPDDADDARLRRCQKWCKVNKPKQRYLPEPASVRIFKFTVSPGVLR